MNELWIALGWVGIYGPIAMGAIGSCIGCARGGLAACGAMLDVDGGYGKFVGLAALPSSQVIYGVVVMFFLNRDVTTTNGPAIFAVGLGVGLALLLNAIYQGACCAAAINASKAKPEVFGLSAAPAGIIEGFAVFAVVFALVVAGGIPA